MKKKPYEIIDGKIHPRKLAPIRGTSDEIVGNYWRIWKQESKCYLEYDKGHFATEMVTVEISNDDYNRISNRPSTVTEVINSKQNSE
jgi:hypothetical protein